MHYPVELVFKSYMPKELELGMFFISTLNPDLTEERIWALKKLPDMPMEKFISQNGAPVELYLVLEDNVIAEPHEIGWWDEGHHTDELRNISLVDINYIITEDEGIVDIEMEEDEDGISPILYHGKVVLCPFGTYDDDDDDEFDDDEEEYEEEEEEENS